MKYHQKSISLEPCPHNSPKNYTGTWCMPSLDYIRCRDKDHTDTRPKL